MFLMMVFILVIATTNCSTPIAEKVKTNGLNSCDSKFVMDDGEMANEYYTNRAKFIAEYTSTFYSGDTLNAETLQEINSCGESICDIKFSNDTLYLLVKQIGNETCASVQFHQFHYTIVKENIEQYVIVY